MKRNRSYLCIDLKSFYASVECRERGLNPEKTNLVVADPKRSLQTLCLAVSPAMKRLGVPGRCRVFQIPDNIQYIMAPPRMALYIKYSAEIYGIYLNYISKEDIHVYSIDEVFMDVTDYLSMYRMSPEELGRLIQKDIYDSKGIIASVGVGSNLYLAKIAMDLIAKHTESSIGSLDEESYRKRMWDHRPLTDFWRIGEGTARKLNAVGIMTMRDLTCADEKMLYRLFGIDAELLIDHAWGRESVTMADIKAYAPKTNSISSSQILPCNYTFEHARLIVKEMADTLCLELVEKHLAADALTLHVAYSRQFPKKPAHGTATMNVPTNSSKQMIQAVSDLYEQLVDQHTPIRRIHLTYLRLSQKEYQQYDIFTDPAEAEKEQRLPEAVLKMKKKYGKNALLKGMNLQKYATGMERNQQIGGHSSGE